MDEFNKWFMRFMYATEIIFLLASMPHIAAWFAHFDSQTDLWSTVYAWTIGFALAFAIDGVSFMTLLAVQRMLKREKYNRLVVFGLLVFMLFIALLSWNINIQYDIQFASNAFAKADAIPVFHTTVGALNPIMGGAFQLLILVYALIGKAVNGDVKPAMTDAQYEAEKKRLLREKELKALRKSDNEAGLLSVGRKKLLGNEKDAKEIRDERLNATVDFLRDAQELLTIDAEPRALVALASLLKLKQKEVLPYLIAARSTISRELTNDLTMDSQADRNTDEMEALERIEDDNQADILTDNETPGNRLRGPIYIMLDDAVMSTGYSKEYLQKLVRTGTLQTKKADKNKLLVSSLNAYISSHKRTGNTGVMPSIPRTESGRSNILDFAQQMQPGEPDKLQIVIETLQRNPDITDEELAEILHMQRPASARFWRLKAQEILRSQEVLSGV